LSGPSKIKGMGNMTHSVTSQEKVESTCSACNGSGKCQQCNGTGKTMLQCSLCAGNGQCKRCQGSGKCLKCAGVGSSGVKCVECSGAGVVISKERINQSRDQAFAKIQTLIDGRQSHEPGSASVKAIVDSLRRMDVSNALTKVDSGELFFFSSFDKKEQTATANDNATAEYNVDASKMSLFDGLIRQSWESKIDLSIDPDAVRSLGETMVDRTDVGRLTSAGQFKDYLSQHGFHAETAPLASGQKVLFVTTPSILMYCTACGYLEKGNLRMASDTIKGTQADNGEYGNDCRALKNTIDVMIKQRDEINKFQHDVDEHLKKFTQAVKSAEMYSHGPGLLSNDRRIVRIGDPTMEWAACLSSLLAACRNLDSLCVSLHNVTHSESEVNGALWDRCLDTHRAHLDTECNVLLNHLASNFVTIKELICKLREAGLTTGLQMDRNDPQNISDIKHEIGMLTGKLSTEGLQNDSAPNELLDLQKNITKEINFSQVCLNECYSYSNINVKLVSQKINDAFAVNRASQAARIGSGYFIVQQYKDAIASLMTTEVHDPSHVTGIEQELRSESKNGVLRSLQSVNGQPLSPASANDKFGNTVAGLAVIAGHGEMDPISVRIERAVKNTMAKKIIYDDYWGTIHTRIEEYLVDEPITFGDYGEKDFYMIVSACEVLKWISFKYPKQMEGKGIHVEFQELFANREGDSAGAAMAVSAYSSLTNTPIRRSVAMTGSIRSDGSVLPVGGILEKVSASATADGIELVIVPKANEPDLLAIPFDDLCRIAIITSDDIETYINFATKADFKKQATEDLQRAQALILLGRRDEAIKILKSLAEGNHELYSARRLLDMLSIYGGKS